MSLDARCDHHRVLEPGSTLFLYTDGLVERRGDEIDAGIDRLCRLLHEHRERPRPRSSTSQWTGSPRTRRTTSSRSRSVSSAASDDYPP